MDQIDDELVGIVGFDTDFFHKKIARIKTNSLNSLQARHVDYWCRRNSIDCVYLLIDSSDESSIRIAEANHYHLIDIRVTMVLSLEIFNESKVLSRYRIVECNESIIQKIKEIGANLFRSSRYYSDGHFSNSSLAKFHSLWIENTFKSKSGLVLAALSSSGEPVGFIAGEFHSGGQSKIVLVGTVTEYSRKGIASALICELASRFRMKGSKCIEVVTQGKNIKAFNLYLKSGFILEKIQLWYHKWF